MPMSFQKKHFHTSLQATISLFVLKYSTTETARTPK